MNALKRMLSATILLVGLFGIRVTSSAAAESAEKFYYAGDVKLSNEKGQPIGSQVILLEKTHDPTKGLIVERAVVVSPDRGVEERTMNMTVKGDTFTLRDTDGTISGTGTLFGPAWHWTYFRATYRAAHGVKIEDENFMTDPLAICARKKVTSPDGKVLMYMDVTLRAITPQTFQILSAALLKK